MLSEEDILENVAIEDKVAAAENLSKRVAIRKFIEESCELAKMLPAPKRMLFVMHFSHGYNITEIAELCNCDPRTVSKRIKIIADELNGMRKLIKGSEKDGKVNKSTKERIEAYFRREANRRRSLRKGKHLAKNI